MPREGKSPINSVDDAVLENEVEDEQANLPVDIESDANAEGAAARRVIEPRNPELRRILATQMELTSTPSADAVPAPIDPGCDIYARVPNSNIPEHEVFDEQPNLPDVNEPEVDYERIKAAEINLTSCPAHFSDACRRRMDPPNSACASYSQMAASAESPHVPDMPHSEKSPEKSQSSLPIDNSDDTLINAEGVAAEPEIAPHPEVQRITSFQLRLIKFASPNSDAVRRRMDPTNSACASYSQMDSCAESPHVPDIPHSEKSLEKSQSSIDDSDDTLRNAEGVAAESEIEPDTEGQRSSIRMRVITITSPNTIRRRMDPRYFGCAQLVRVSDSNILGAEVFDEQPNIPDANEPYVDAARIMAAEMNLYLIRRHIFDSEARQRRMDPMNSACAEFSQMASCTESPNVNEPDVDAARIMAEEMELYLNRRYLFDSDARQRRMDPMNSACAQFSQMASCTESSNVPDISSEKSPEESGSSLSTDDSDYTSAAEDQTDEKADN